MQPLTATRATAQHAPREPDRPRTDPAPSRAAYRLQRVMLTPAYRLTLRVILPFLLSMSLSALYLSDETRRDALLRKVHDIRNQVETRPEFMVRLMAVEGASAGIEADIREISQIDFPISTFDLDLDNLRSAIIGLPAVADARARVRQLGVLEVTVTEREPALVWRSREGLQLIDRTGIVIGELGARTDRADLPLIAGHRASEAVAEALALIEIAAPFRDRLRGLERIGERRWDVVLEPDLRIMLPDRQPELALERAIALHEAQDVLDRDVAALDLRLAARPTVRMNAGALDRWRQIKDVYLGTGDR
ncbi:cell division protein ftsQ [Pseudooceanicola batsensis HTCC2597]|uniref:Cell division protein FtsQ n=1 Tax=Pseudooceanicola batsensis (strain ATCC BAA-863 / DSM 15984 / KCTC 12145 / HTCC2597) TaxID=252305 RepID=A3TZC2_PSEBH|nr:cell division protein FtsQ/DivIB [Pseudooceanicola batsensis]EAQ02940.1 cell division protein ftsQ [Pseudooceanicola batsensis HTCC2597]